VRVWAQALGASRLRCLVDLEDERSAAITRSWGFSASPRVTRDEIARAAKEAVADAGLNGFDPHRVGIVFGSAIGGLIGIVEQAETLRDRGPDRVSPYFIPSVLVDSASGQIAISLGLRGPNYAPVSACATGSHGVGEGAELIRRGAADVILAGGTEACIHPLILAGFTAMRGLAAEEEHPPRASRPFDATRDGFVLGEGAGSLFLEDLELAKARGAKIDRPLSGPGFPRTVWFVDPDGVSNYFAQFAESGR